MHEFVFRKAGFDWVVRDVAAQVVELFGRADEMVETVLLPEATARADGSVDLCGLPVLPTLALLEQGFIIGECRQQMHMIGITTKSLRS